MAYTHCVTDVGYRVSDLAGLAEGDILLAAIQDEKSHHRLLDNLTLNTAADASRAVKQTGNF